MKKTFGRRMLVLICLTLVFFAAGALRLYYFQVANGPLYQELADTTASDTYTYTAARGEIVDRYGRLLVTNRVGYNVNLNRTYLRPEDLNATLFRLTAILSSAGEAWADSLPMERQAPYTFLSGQDDALAGLKALLGLNVYATEENVLDKLVQRYDLEAYSRDDQRMLGGIRYEMEMREYGFSVPFTLAQDVSVKTVATIKENSVTLRGVDIAEETVRVYPDGTLAPHILGTVGPIYKEEYETLKADGYKMDAVIGKSGLEKTYESVLRGTDGLIEITRSATGEILSSEVVSQPSPGKTVVLTIDRDLQAVTQQSLAKVITELQQTQPAGQGREADAGAAVVLNVKTGEILACASYPGYDLSNFNSMYATYAADSRNPLFNRALQGVYRPGSIFKCATATAGLMYNVITPDSTIYCNHLYTFWADTGWLPQCTGTHGNINVMQALKVSCNIFFYDTGRRLGLERIMSVAAAYGLGQSTGIELPEAVGMLTEKGENWQEGNIIQAAIGQMDTMITPLQMAVYAATIGNMGVRNAAHIVKTVRSYDYAQTVDQAQTTELSRVEAEPWVFDTVEQGMLLASTEYNAQIYLGNYPIHIASKTGTAQAGGYYNGTIIAYGPTEDPEIAVAVVVEKGFNGYRMASVVRDVFDYYYFSGTSLAVQQGEGQLVN